MSEPGRSCPLHYRYRPESLDRAPSLEADSIYVVGGLYGNLPALERIEAMSIAESAATKLIFNGDFNWFNVDVAGFEAVNQRVLRHPASRGNVETEMGTDDGRIGCVERLSFQLGPAFASVGGGAPAVAWRFPTACRIAFTAIST